MNFPWSKIIMFNTSTGAGSFGVGGTGYTGISLLTDRMYLNGNTELSGLVLNNQGASPIIFSTSNTERARIGGAGDLTLTTYVSCSALSTDVNGLVACVGGSGPGSAGGWTDVATNVYLTNLTDYVGIGTATPATKLHIRENTAGILESRTENPNAGVTSEAAVTAYNDVNEYIGFEIFSSTYSGREGKAWLTSVGTELGIVIATDSSPIVFGTTANLTERMRIDSNGFIGIGTSAPTTKLEVQGTASASYLLTGNTLQVGGYASVGY